ncbi:Leucine-rich repeat-containing protein 15 [Pseudolycoriella hygida]|uniref:Leucine-rich repeat-containing protein 15 n=1 Tax=Pseudolycoriella hygida TaxID=35572 RepID=A0A9Q0RVN3_9DIPT|nr:Leucine-rich repeat-containing protein 15 [Pseudolycoriella hygida]
MGSIEKEVDHILPESLHIKRKTSVAVTFLLLVDILSPVFGGQCRFYSTDTDYACELSSARFLESTDQFVITGDHLPSFTNRDVTTIHTSTANPSHLRLIPSNITSATFSSCSNLIEIDVSINRINDVHVNAFGGLNALRQIRLNSNSISTLPPGTFNTVPTVEMIQLHTNNFETIPANVFHDLPSLLTLHLHTNRITRVQSNAFNNLPQLGTIWLNQNLISDIDSDAFISTQGLYQIYLQDNFISRLSSSTFGESTPRLRGIFLANNRIIAIETNFFQRGIRIEVFNIVNNLCASIAFDPTFANIPVLLQLCFRNWEDGTEITTTSSTTAAPTTTTGAPGTGLKTLPKFEIICFIRISEKVSTQHIPLRDALIKVENF